MIHTDYQPYTVFSLSQLSVLDYMVQYDLQPIYFQYVSASFYLNFYLDLSMPIKYGIWKNSWLNIVSLKIYLQTYILNTEHMNCSIARQRPKGKNPHTNYDSSSTCLFYTILKSDPRFPYYSSLYCIHQIHWDGKTESMSFYLETWNKPWLDLSPTWLCHKNLS